MKSIDIDKNILELVYKYINDELQEQEKQQLFSWIETGQENKDLFIDILKNNLQIRWVEEEQAIKLRNEKHKLMDKIRPKRNFSLIYKIAASIIIIISLGTFFYIYNKQPEEIIQIARIEPVSSKAQLVLSTGEVIDLEQKGNIISESDGTKIAIEEGLGIIYDDNLLADTEEIIYNKLVVPRGGEYYIKLTDGTEIWLNAQTELEYPVRFNDNERKIKLKGEAYFKVAQELERRFIVSHNDNHVVVYGTEFNVNTYNSQIMQTVLVEGSVGIKSVNGNELILLPNQLGTLNMQTGELQKQEVSVESYIAWKNKDIVFKSERLDSIMEKISMWYDVDYVFENEELKNYLYDINIPRYSELESFLELLEKTSDVKFRIQNRNIFIGK